MKKGSYFKDWRVWLGIAISVGAMYWAFKDVEDPKMIWRAIKQANIGWLLIAVLPIAFSMAIRSWRWKYFIKNDDSSFRTRYNALVIGSMATNLFPLRLGEFIRAYVFAVKQKRNTVEIISTVASERLFDMLSLLLLLIISLPFVPAEGLSTMLSNKFGIPPLSRTELITWSAVLALALFAAFLLLCYYGRPVARFFRNRLSLHGGLIERYARAFFDGIETPLQSGHLIAITLSSLGAWFLIGVAYYCAALAFPAGDGSLGTIIGLWGAVYLEAIVCVGIALPAAPGFFGVWHAAALLAFQPYMSAYAVLEMSTVLAFAVIAHLLGYFLSLLMGVESLYNEGMSLGKIRSVAKEESAGPEENA